MRYVCGLLVMPGEYLRRMPRLLHAAAGRLVARSIAAGQGCDCDVEVLPPSHFDEACGHSATLPQKPLQ
jgi:hypothetical protein